MINEPLDILIKRLDSADSEERRQAVTAIGDLGEAGRPVVGQLMALMNDPDLGLRAEIQKTLIRIGPEALLIINKKLAYEAQGIGIFPRFKMDWLLPIYIEFQGITGDPIPILAQQIRGGKLRWVATVLLGELGDAGMDALFNVLLDSKYRSRVDLGKFDPVMISFGEILHDPAFQDLYYVLLMLIRGGDALYPRVLALLEDEDLYRQRAGLAVLNYLADHLRNSPPGPEIKTVLLSLLKGTNKMLRYQALNVIRRLGASARDTEPVLVSFLHEEQDPDLLSADLMAIGAIEPTQPATMKAVACYLGHPNTEISKAAAISLRGFGLAAAPAIPALVEWTVVHRQEPGGIEGIRSLAAMGEAAVPAIRQMLMEPERRQFALDVIRKMKDADQYFLDEVIDGLRSNQDPVKCPERLVLYYWKQKDSGGRAESALQEFHQREMAWIEQRKTVNVALERIKSTNRFQRNQAADDLAKANERHDEIARALLVAMLSVDLENSDESAIRDSRKRMARCLGDLGPNARAIIPDLIRLITGGDPFLRELAVTVIDRITPAVPVETAEEFSGMLGHEDSTLRHAALAVIKGCGPKALGYVPDLLERLCDRLRDPVPEVRLRAIQVIGSMGPAAQRVLPRVRQSRYECTLKLSKAAREALDRIMAPDPT